MVPLSCTIEAPQTAPLAGPVMLRFVLRNVGDGPLRVLAWGTPWEGRWTAPFVRVSRDGADLPYDGPMVKRMAPAPRDYFVLRPGDRREARLDLGDAFLLDRSGLYRVVPTIRLPDVRAPDEPGDAPHLLVLDCADVTVTLR